MNFLGFKASAGLGGLLSGKSGFGGLHAEAGTPFGQAARAGIGGNLDGEGKKILQYNIQIIFYYHTTYIMQSNSCKLN